MNYSKSLIQLAVVLLTVTSFLGCSKAANVGTAETGSSVAGISVEFPHSDNFKKNSLHGSQYLSDPFQCAKCHATDFSGGSAKVACNQCHTHFPHISGWGKPENHGKTFASLADTERKQCLNCHVRDSSKNPQNGTKIPQCADCHLPYPHDYPVDEGFRQGEGHHSEYATSYDGKCMACHRNAIDNMPNNPTGCRECHVGNVEISWKSRPHDRGWAKPQVHGKTYLSLSKTDKAACMKCHGKPSTDPADAANPKKTPACNDCHKAYPHDDDFETGDGLHPELAKSFAGQCTLCHRNLVDNMPTYGGDGGCIYCHTGVPVVSWKKIPPSPTPSPSSSAAPGQVSVTPVKTNKSRVPSSQSH